MMSRDSLKGNWQRKPTLCFKHFYVNECSLPAASESRNSRVEQVSPKTLHLLLIHVVNDSAVTSF